MIKKTSAIIVAFFCLIAPALADEGIPDTEQGRYSFSKVADGLLRLDMQTGEVSICSQRAVGWACQAAPEDRAILENEIARLRAENAALKKDMLAHGLTLPGVATAEPPTPPPAAAPNGDRPPKAGDNSDIDRMVEIAGRLWHRFVEAIARAQKQMLDNKS
jgi:hypothetical protein